MNQAFVKTAIKRKNLKLKKENKNKNASSVNTGSFW